MKLLRFDSPVIRFFERAFELLALNLFALLLCVPLFTAGGAMTALYKTLFDLRQQKGRALKGFFQTFAAEFRPALPLGLLCAAGLAAYGAYLYLLYPLLAAGTIWAWIAISAIGALFFFQMAYVFPLFAKFQNTVKTTIVNAFVLSLRHLFVTILVLAMRLLPIALILLLPNYAAFVILIWLFVGISLPAYLASGRFLKVFSLYAEL